MTPERLNELAGWLTQASAEELLDDIDNVAAISEFLRECAKTEPVGVVKRDKYGLTGFIAKDIPVDSLLYTAPQVL